MSDHIKLVKACLQDAPHDERAVRVLRKIVHGVAESAPVGSLVAIVEAMMSIRQAERQRALERN